MIPSPRAQRNTYPKFRLDLISARGSKVAEVLKASDELPANVRALPAYAEMPQFPIIIYRERSVELRKFGGCYALDEALRVQAEEYGVVAFLMVAQDRMRKLLTPMTRFAELGFVMDYGWGPQRFMKINYWDVVIPNGVVVPAKLPQPKPTSGQMSLFGEVA